VSSKPLNSWLIAQAPYDSISARRRRATFKKPTRPCHRDNDSLTVTLLTLLTMVFEKWSDQVRHTAKTLDVSGAHVLRNYWADLRQFFRVW